MAVVWLARTLDIRDGRLVVVKMLLPQYAMDEQFQQMFVDEANISSGITHPNVARILDAGESQSTPYLVMEYIDGESIARLTEGVKKAQVRFPPGIALRLIADAASGLHAAHELRDRHGALLNVVHRDVSPQNILVRSVGTAAVIDFGIAKARDRLAEETRAGNLKGKVRYMAPEQALGKAVDRRVDVWALGAMVFEIFAGKGPYEGGSEIAALQRLVKGQKPSELPAQVPEPVRHVIGLALTPNPADRLPTAAALAEALDVAIAELGEPTSPAHVAAFAAPYMRDRSAARVGAAREAMAQLDAVAGIRGGALQATASGGYVAVTPEMADDATQINLQYSPEDDGPADDPRTIGYAPPAPPSAPRPDFRSTLAMPPGTSFPPYPPSAPSAPPAATYSSVPPSNIAASISEVLSASQRGGGFGGPTGTLPPPSGPVDLPGLGASGYPAPPSFGAPMFPHADAPPAFQPHGHGPAPLPPGSHPQLHGFGPEGPPSSSYGAGHAPAEPPPVPAKAPSRRGLKVLVALIVLAFLLTGTFVALSLTDRI